MNKCHRWTKVWSVATWRYRRQLPRQLEILISFYFINFSKGFTILFESALTKLAKKKKKNTLNTCIRHIYYLSSNVQSFPSSFLNALSQQPLTTNRKKRIFSRAIDTSIDLDRTITDSGSQGQVSIYLSPGSLTSSFASWYYISSSSPLPFVERWTDRGFTLNVGQVRFYPYGTFSLYPPILSFIIYNKKKPRSRSRYELQIGQCVSNARASNHGSTAGNAYLARERERRRGRRDWTVSLAQDEWDEVKVRRRSIRLLRAVKFATVSSYILLLPLSLR